MTTTEVRFAVGDRVELGLPAWLAKDKGIASREIAAEIIRVTPAAIQVRAHVMVRECETCQNCGRDIDNPASRLLGFGPTCSERLGLPHADTYAAMSPAEREQIRNRVARESTIECWLPRSQVEVKSHEPAILAGAGGLDGAAVRADDGSGPRAGGGVAALVGTAVLSAHESEKQGHEPAIPAGPVRHCGPSGGDSVGLRAASDRGQGGDGLSVGPEGDTAEELSDRERWAKADAYLNDPERVAAARAMWERKPEAQEPEAPPPNPRQVTWNGARFCITFPFNASLVTEVKRIPGARWDNPRKTWEVPESSGAELVRFVAENFFEMAPEVAEHAEQARARAEVNAQESRSSEADFHVEGLGGTLRPFQRVGVSYSSRQRRVILADEMRLGKSPQALATLCHTESYPALLVVPATLKSAWRREAERWLPGRSVAVLEGKAPREPDNWIEVQPALRYAEKYAAWFDECLRQLRSAEILVINYDILMDWAGVRWTVNSRGKRIVDVCDGPLSVMLFRGLVCDEFHRHVLGRKAQRTLVLQHLAAQWRTQCREVMHDMVQLLLSGTPMRKQAADLIQPLQIIDRLDDMGGWYGYATRYCGYASGVMGSVRVPPEAMVELNQRLRSVCMVRRRRRDVYAEIPKVERHIIPFTIDNRAEYQQAERDVAGWAASHALKDKEFNRSLEGMDPEERRAARKARAQDAAFRAQRAEGLVRISALKRLAAHGKMAAVADWIANYMEESGEKLIVGAWHQEIVEEVASRFKAPFIHGGVSAGRKDEAVTRFQRCAACGRSHELHYARDFPCPAYKLDTACPLIAINFQSGGMGLTLTAANDTAIIELGWTPDDMDQLEMRVGHIDKPDPASHWYLLAEDTIEEDIMAILDRRRREVSTATDGEMAGEDRGMMEELLERMAARAAAT